MPPAPTPRRHPPSPTPPVGPVIPLGCVSPIPTGTFPGLWKPWPSRTTFTGPHSTTSGNGCTVHAAAGRRPRRLVDPSHGPRWSTRHPRPPDPTGTPPRLRKTLGFGRGVQRPLVSHPKRYCQLTWCAFRGRRVADGVRQSGPPPLCLVALPKGSWLRRSTISARGERRRGTAGLKARHPPTFYGLERLPAGAIPSVATSASLQHDLGRVEPGGASPQVFHTSYCARSPLGRRWRLSPPRALHPDGASMPRRRPGNLR